MDSFQVYQFLDIIQGESSTNVKISLLEEFLEDELFYKIVQYAYDPFITFGVKNIVLVGKGSDNFDEVVFHTLDQLKSRELTGNAARDALVNIAKRMSKESAYVLQCIIDKDLKAGFGPKSINKAMPETIPEFSYMRCSLPKHVNLQKLDWLNGIYSQEKLDGMFINLSYTNDDRLLLHTRKGQELDIYKFIGIGAEAKTFLDPGYQYHGEIIVKINDVFLDRKTSNGLMNHVLKGGSFDLNQIPVFIVWDMVPLKYAYSGKTYEVPYKNRLATLNSFTVYNHIQIIQTNVIYNLDEATQHFNEIRAKGGEGTILKERLAIWKNGTSRQQIKLKAEYEAEMRVLTFLPGTGKNESTFGSLLCTSEDGRVSAAVSGITDELRQKIWNEKEEWKGAIITVRYNELIEDKNGEYSVFLPRFVERRYDREKASYLREFQ